MTNKDEGLPRKPNYELMAIDTRKVLIKTPNLAPGLTDVVMEEEKSRSFKKFLRGDSGEGDYLTE